MLLRRFKLTLTFLYIYIYKRLNLNTFSFIIILVIIIFWIGINNENNTWTHFKFENLILVSYFKKINVIIHILTITWDSHHPFFYHFLILCDIRFFIYLIWFAIFSFYYSRLLFLLFFYLYTYLIFVSCLNRSFLLSFLCHLGFICTRNNNQISQFCIVEALFVSKLLIF